jgi:hypothetical protein
MLSFWRATAWDGAGVIGNISGVLLVRFLSSRFCCWSPRSAVRETFVPVWRTKTCSEAADKYKRMLRISTKKRMRGPRFARRWDTEFFFVRWQLTSCLHWQALGIRSDLCCLGRCQCAHGLWNSTGRGRSIVMFR